MITLTEGRSAVLSEEAAQAYIDAYADHLIAREAERSISGKLNLLRQNPEDLDAACVAVNKRVEQAKLGEQLP